MNKYKKVIKPKNSVVKDEEEIRVTAAGSVSAYVSRAAKLFNELEKRYIVIAATGNAFTKAVTSAEVIKRRFKGLHQVTKLGSQSIVDEYEPLEEGLDPVSETRNLPFVEIKLSKDPLDSSDSGYQPPLDEAEVKEYDAEELMARGRGRGRGSGGKGRGKGKGKGKSKDGGKGKSKDESPEPKGKGKGAGKGKGKGKDVEEPAKGKGKGKGKSKDEPVGKGKAKGKGKEGKGTSDGWSDDYPKGKGKGKEPKGKGKGKKGWDEWDTGAYRGPPADQYKGKSKGAKGKSKAWESDWHEYDRGYGGGYDSYGYDKGKSKGKGKDKGKGKEKGKGKDKGKGKWGGY